jgi:hypothetical protein
MSDPIEMREHSGNLQIPSREEAAVHTPDAAQEQKKSIRKGMLMMAVCCAAPLLLLAAIPFLGFTLGSYAALGSGLLSIVTLLACPVGMFLMMRMMMTGKK